MSELEQRVAEVIAPIMYPQLASCMEGAFHAANGQRKRKIMDVAKSVIQAHAEWWPKPSENPAYLAAFKVRHGRETDGKEFDGQLWQWLRVAHEATSKTGLRT